MRAPVPGAKRRGSESDIAFARDGRRRSSRPVRAPRPTSLSKPCNRSNPRAIAPGSRAGQVAATGIFPIRARHSRGPVSCTEVPFASTATVTGMSRTSNS